MSQYLSRIEGPPPKRNVAGSIPVWDARNNAESLDFYWFSAFFIYDSLSLLKKDFCTDFTHPYSKSLLSALYTDKTAKPKDIIVKIIGNIALFANVKSPTFA